jgi:hypothetical protein
MGGVNYFYFTVVDAVAVVAVALTIALTIGFSIFY